MAFVFGAHGREAKLRLQEHGQHEFERGQRRAEIAAVAGVLEHLHGLVAQFGFAGGEDGKGFEGHGADGDAVFGEPGTD